MTENVEERDISACGNSPKAHGKVTIPVKSGYAEEQIVELELGCSATAILEIVAAERDCLVEELILVREGESEPLSPAIVVDENYPHKHCHHIHYPGEVNVTVYYQSGTSKPRVQTV